jgi:hypothetical protein
MKKIIIILSLLVSGSINGQELLNFYLEPNTNGDGVILYTTVQHYNLAYILEDLYEINGNVIEFNLCYANTFFTSGTYDEQEFEIILPSGNPNFIFNINFFTWDENGQCDYTTTIDTGAIFFDFPYNPAGKTFVPDKTFEAFFEYYNIGDDIADNDYVFTHRIKNLRSLDLNYQFISPFGPRIVDLTGIEILYRLKELKCSDNEITQFDGTNHPQLEYLRIRNDQLESVDLSFNADLWYLEIGSENLIDLDISTKGQILLNWTYLII